MSEKQRKPPPLFYNGLHVPYVIANCCDLSFGARLLYAALVDAERPDGSTRQRTLEEVSITLGATREEVVKLVLELIDNDFIEHDPENKISPRSCSSHSWITNGSTRPLRRRTSETPRPTGSTRNRIRG